MSNEQAPLSSLELERLVLDAEVASGAILDTPKLQPASLGNLVALTETITNALNEVEEAYGSHSDEAKKLRNLQKRMFAILRQLSGARQG